jgi:hypothetical protein
VVIKIALADASAFGEPDAGKLASPVRRGTIGNVLVRASNALAVYPTQGVAGSSPARCAKGPGILLQEESDIKQQNNGNPNHS